MLCANCFSNVTEEEVVYSIVDKSPMHKECANTCKSCGGYLTDTQFMRNKCKCVVQIKSSVSLVRRSHLELYKKCPYAFYMECIKGIEQEMGKHALHGVILHEIFDKYSTQTDFTKEMLQQEFVERWSNEKGDVEDELNEKLIEKGYNAIDGFMVFYNKVNLPYITEENIIFEVEEGLPSVSITMDRIDKDQFGDLHLVDYKCGKTFTGKKLAEDLQVPTYCYAVYKQHGTLPKTFTFLFVSEGKERVYTLVDDDTYECKVRNRTYAIKISKALEEVKTILTNISKGNFSVKSTDFWHCNNYCSYKKNNMCDGGDDKIWG